MVVASKIAAPAKVSMGQRCYISCYLFADRPALAVTLSTLEYKHDIDSKILVRDSIVIY